jgi:hypothetical protein
MSIPSWVRPPLRADPQVLVSRVASTPSTGTGSAVGAGSRIRRTSLPAFSRYGQAQ